MKPYIAHLVASRQGRPDRGYVFRTETTDIDAIVARWIARGFHAGHIFLFSDSFGAGIISSREWGQS